jgi:rod shape-determining protein MreC
MNYFRLEKSRKQKKKSLFFKTNFFSFLCLFTILTISLSYYLNINLFTYTKLRLSSFIAYVAYRPIHWASNIQDSVKTYKSLAKENQDLKDEKEVLTAKLLKQESTLSELKELESVLSDMAYPTAKGKMIKVLGSMNVFPHSTLYCMGSEKDVYQPNQVILASQGVIGKTVETSDRLVKIILLTDHLSRIPVRLQKTGKQAIIAGQGTAELRVIPIDHFQEISAQTPIQQDDLFVTSGLDDIYPPDLPVARVSSIQNSEVFAEPIANLLSLRFVEVLPLKTQPGKVSPP